MIEKRKKGRRQALVPFRKDEFVAAVVVIVIVVVVVAVLPFSPPPIPERRSSRIKRVWQGDVG